MTEEAVLEKLRKAVVTYDAEAAKEAAKESLEKGVDPVKAIHEGLAKGMEVVSRLFENEEIFLPHLLLAADAMKAGVELLTPAILEQKKMDELYSGTVVLGTVQGDIHEIGASLVKVFLEAAGFKVYYLGRDIPVEDFIARAEEVNADIIASSALMTSTMPEQRKIEETLRKRGIRDRFITMVGGSPVSREWAEKISADGYAPDAVEAAKVAAKLLREKEVST